MEDNVKVLVTSTPSILPRTYDRSKCGICLENMLFADRKSREQLRQYLSKDGVSSLKRAANITVFSWKYWIRVMMFYIR